MKRFVIWSAVSTKAQSKDDRHSLPLQEREGREFAESEGGEVVDVLRVPGHSRRYKDFNELSVKAAKAGIDAFARLEQHWRNKDFDVLWVRDGDRFARTQSLHARITEEIIDAGAVIYSASDGWIDRHNYRMWTAMSGYRAAGQIDQFVAMTRKTKDERAALGLITNNRPIWPYKVVRNELGRIVQVVADESKRLIIQDAARLVLEGFGWSQIEIELARRYGHMKDGKPFYIYFFYHLFHNPFFWGHNARRWHSVKSTRKWDLWIFGPGLGDPPEGALVFYNTHPPYLNDDLGARLKAELMRRYSTVRGSTRPRRTRRFAGLLVCGHCGSRLVYWRKPTALAYYRCPARFNKMYVGRRHCPGQMIREEAIQKEFDAALAHMLDLQEPHYFLQRDDTDDGSIELLKARIADVQDHARRLISKQSAADSVLSSLYDEQLTQVAAELRALQNRLANAEENLDAYERAEAEAAYEELIAYESLEAFWTSPEVEVNQLLHRLMGRHRLVYLNKRFARVIEV